MGVRRVGALSRDTGGVGETSKDVPSGALRSHASLEEPWMMLKSSSRRIAPTSVDINPPTTLIPSEGPLLVGQNYPCMLRRRPAITSGTVTGSAASPGPRSPPARSEERRGGKERGNKTS